MFRTTLSTTVATMALITSALTAPATAQTTPPDLTIGSLQTVLPNTNGYGHCDPDGQPTDYTIPAGIDTLRLMAHGGNGGDAQVNNCWAEGGEGATVGGYVVVGPNAGEVQPGGILRFVVGNDGYSNDNTGEAGGASGQGGGATGILYLAPGLDATVANNWVLLMVAGAGGGAHAAAFFCVDTVAGGSGNPYSTSGSAGGGTNGGAGGTGGGDGGTGGAGLYPGYGGKGFHSSGVAGSTGEPAFHAGPSSPGLCWYGTYGLGGGGYDRPWNHVSGLKAGGGGGGYSGGGGGSESSYGGGGGSFINAAYVQDEIRGYDEEVSGAATYQTIDFNNDCDEVLAMGDPGTGTSFLYMSFPWMSADALYYSFTNPAAYDLRVDWSLDSPETLVVLVGHDEPDTCNIQWDQVYANQTGAGSFYLPAGTTATVLFSRTAGPGANTTMTLTPTPSALNDESSWARSIGSGLTLTGTSFLAFPELGTDSGVASTCGPTVGASQDVWFSYVNDTAATTTLFLQWQAVLSTYAWVEVTDPVTGAAVACGSSDNFSYPQPGHVYLPVPPGETRLIRVAQPGAPFPSNGALEISASVSPYQPWSQIGQGLAGTYGTPVLTGTGTLEPSSQNALDLTGAVETSLAVLVVGAGELNAPFSGGIFYPTPDELYFFGTGFQGPASLNLPFGWPAGIPGSTPIHLQFWIEDPAGPFGYAASNGLRIITPPQ